jgi:phytoene dehydrogenase-like protein
MKKKIIIIGAGIAGLSAGCYAQMNGYDAEIFEMHNISGGLCTAWKRKGYVFDGCIHFLVGTNPQSRLHNLWNEVGALNGKEIINHDVYMQIEGNSGKKLILYCDMDKLEKHMSELSPIDTKSIKELTDAIRNFSIAGNASEEVNGSRLRQISMKEFITELHDPFLREALSTFGNMEFFLMTMYSYSRNDAGWPIGGSMGIARGIEKRFLELGGHIRYKSKVEEILVGNGCATGIRLADGAIHNADYVISTANGYATIFHILQGKYINHDISTLYSNAKTYPTSIQISLGVDCDLSDEPHDLFLKLDTPVNMAGVEKRSIWLKNYCFDKTLCPEGKSVVTTIITSDYEYWDILSQDRKSYKAEKENIAATFIKIFENRFPQARGKDEVFDVATPMTYSRYTGAWKGAYMGWMSTPQWPVMSVPSTLPGLDAFYMAGQWTHPRGGLPIAFTTARGTLMKICEVDGKRFVTKLD